MATGSSFHSGGSGSRNGPSFASPSSSSGVPGQAQPMAVVWEWQDDLGFWRPYTGQVCSYIEQCLQHQRGAATASSSSSSSICLAQADPSLSAYIIDIPNLKQFRQDTGECDLRLSLNWLSTKSTLVVPWCFNSAEYEKLPYLYSIYIEPQSTMVLLWYISQKYGSTMALFGTCFCYNYINWMMNH